MAQPNNILNMFNNQYNDEKGVYFNYPKTEAMGINNYQIHNMDRTQYVDFKAPNTIESQNLHQKLYYESQNRAQLTGPTLGGGHHQLDPSQVLEFKPFLQKRLIQDVTTLNTSVGQNIQPPVSYGHFDAKNLLVEHSIFSQVQNDNSNQTSCSQMSGPTNLVTTSNQAYQNRPIDISSNNLKKQQRQRKPRKPNQPKKVTKKRERDPERWSRNVRKKLKNTGKEYISSSGKKIEKKEVKPPCGSKCRLKCADRVTQEQRQELFDRFWSVGDIVKQRNFIVRLVGTIVPKYRYAKANSNRSMNFSFHFEINKVRMRVCKKFFTATLDIGDTMMRTAIKKYNEELDTIDKRGRHSNHRKIDPKIQAEIKKHIEDSLPKIQSYYVKREDMLTIPRLYKEYREECLRENRCPGKMYVYRNVFKTEFKHYAHWFFPTKKGCCRICDIFQNLSNEEKKILMVEFGKHNNEKHWE